MEDNVIVELYVKRDERAVYETERKYGRYLTKVACNVLYDMEDSLECVNDTYLKVWNSIPPHQPAVFLAYISRITRQLSIDAFRRRNSEKRKNTEYAVSLSELGECVEGKESLEQKIELNLLASAISKYLGTLPEEKRNAFVCRYFFADSIKDIADYSGASEAKIKSMLHRIRIGLKEYLEREGFVL